ANRARRSVRAVRAGSAAPRGCNARRLLVLSNVNWRARLLARFFPRLFEKLLVPRLSGLKPQP
ncbi:hypothetical protein ACG3RS_21625, partial [Pseudomonas aeruginosa]